MKEICKMFRLSRQAFYQHRKFVVNELLQEEVIIQMVKEYRAKMPRLGGRKLYYLLKSDLEQLPYIPGRDKFFDLLRKNALLVSPTKQYTVTTQSHHRFRVYTNLISERKVSRINEVFVADITYLRLFKGFCYLFLITDVYSRKIVGYDVSESLSVDGALRAARMAFRGITSKQELIHHSDRGVHYCCNAYVKLMQKHSVRLSMGETGNPYDNAIAERVNGILKTEFLLNGMFQTVESAKRAAQEAIETYNNFRPHMSIDYLTPSMKYTA